MESPLLDVADLNVHYGGARALHDVTFQVLAGEVFSIIGSNGAGKTTLVKTLAGLLRPSSGEARFDGSRIDGQTPAGLVDRGISLVPEGRGLFLNLTVQENLDLGAFPQRSRSRAAESLEEVLALFGGLRPLLRRTAGKLSGGEQQMLAIARSLMSRPRLLMLDEPSLGLAPFVVRTLFETILRLKARGVTILLIEQNVRQALKISDRGCVIQTGRIAMTGSGRDLLTAPEVQKAYMGALQ